MQNNFGDSIDSGKSYINPWSSSVTNDLLKKMNPQIIKYNVRRI